MPSTSNPDNSQESERDSQRAQRAANLAYLVVQTHRRDQQEVDPSSNCVDAPEN